MPANPNPDHVGNHTANRLLHELDIPKYNVAGICELAGISNPQVYTCLRDESVMTLPVLERLGAALGYKLKWVKK